MKLLEHSLSQEEKSIQTTTKMLKKAGLLVLPSDTVYALCVDATLQSAVDKLITFKKRAPGKPISIFVADIDQAQKIVSINHDQKKILQKLTPGPFTIVLPYKAGLAHGLASEKNTLGIRIVSDRFIQTLLARYKKPLTATSANLSGRPPHYSIGAFLHTLSDKKKKEIDLIVDRGTLSRNQPSTVIDLTSGDVQAVRKGDIVLGKKAGSFISYTPDETKKIGAFLLKKYLHEAFDKPLIFLIEGELGVGKTVLVAGMAGAFGIDHIVSPTFVIYYEYDVKIGDMINGKDNPRVVPTKFYHFDLYNIIDKDEFRHLKIDALLSAKKIVCIEWGEKTFPIFDTLKQKGYIVRIKINYQTERERTINIIEN